MSATTPQMPFRREPTAPIFDPSQPRSLLRYFEDLEELFSRCGIHDLEDRKKWTLRYVPIEVADFWELLPGWTGAVDWTSLKRNVAARYPACDDEHRYRFADLVALADSQMNQEISSIEQWSEFLNQYLVISQYLITRHHLDPLEQQRYLLRSLSPSLRYEVESYLYRVDPRRDPEQLASVAELDTAVQYCLRILPHSTPGAISTIIKTEPSNSPQTVEQLSAIVAKLIEKELAKWEYPSSSPSMSVITPALDIAPVPLVSLARKPQKDRVFASISSLIDPIDPVRVPSAARRTFALPQEKQLRSERVLVPMREEPRKEKPHEQATMTKKMERELPSQECSEQPLIAVFPLSQVPKAPQPRVEEELQPKVPVKVKAPEVEPYKASKLRSEPVKKEIEISLVSPSPHQPKVPSPAAFVPSKVVSSHERVQSPLAARIKSIISQRSLQEIFQALSTIFTINTALIHPSYPCFAKSPSHRKHRARYRRNQPRILKF